MHLHNNTSCYIEILSYGLLVLLALFLKPCFEHILASLEFEMRSSICSKFTTIKKLCFTNIEFFAVLIMFSKC